MRQTPLPTRLAFGREKSIYMDRRGGNGARGKQQKEKGKRKKKQGCPDGYNDVDHFPWDPSIWETVTNEYACRCVVSSCLPTHQEQFVLRKKKQRE